MTHPKNVAHRYKSLHRWLDQRSSFGREKRYYMGAPGPQKTTPVVLNTRTVRCRPRRGTGNPELGAYRLKPEPSAVLLQCHAEIGRRHADLRPRLRKPQP